MVYADRKLERDGVSLNYIDEGDGPVVLLVHGFPDSIHLWRHQITALLDAGYRVIAVDNRGMGQSDAPTDIDAYALDEVVSDLVAILDARSVKQFAVAGHDWGAMIAWSLVDRIVDRITCFISVSAGPPQCYAGSDDIRQKEMGWYTLMFLIEGVAEEMLMANDWKLFRQFVRHHCETEHWISDLCRNGRLTASLNIYRANVLPVLSGGIHCSSRAPTLDLWSTGDAYLVEEQMLAAGRFVQANWHYEKVDQASHWMMLDRPAHLSRLLLNHLGQYHPVY